MQTIDYEKYSNMSQKQLLNSLINAEKQEQKIKKQMQEKQKLIYFLKTKMKESLDTSKQSFKPLKQTSSYKQFQEIKAQMTEQEKQELETEVQKEMSKDYSNEL